MMKSMLDAAVHTEGGKIWIEQNYVEETKRKTWGKVAFHPEQVPLLIKWIEEATSDLLADGK